MLCLYKKGIYKWSCVMWNSVWWSIVFSLHEFFAIGFGNNILKIIKTMLSFVNLCNIYFLNTNILFNNWFPRSFHYPQLFPSIRDSITLKNKQFAFLPDCALHSYLNDCSIQLIIFIFTCAVNVNASRKKPLVCINISHICNLIVQTTQYIVLYM